MISLFEFTQDLFQWCNEQGIQLALARPKYKIKDFVDTDLDILINNDDVEKISNWLQEQDYKITCHYQRSDGVTLHLYHEIEEGYRFIQIDFITSLENRGIAYLKINNVLDRRIIENNIYHPDMVDQFIILIMTHGLKHQDYKKLASYYPFLLECLAVSPEAIQNSLSHILGNEQALETINAIKQNEEAKLSFLPFITASWKILGLGVFFNLFVYFITEFYRRITFPKYKIVFLGVDGSGKTSLINHLKKQIKGIYPTVKHCHLLPALPWQVEKDANRIESPHGEKDRSYIASVAKLFYFLIRYYFIEFYPVKQPVLYLYDRYYLDLLIDPKRFRYNGPKNKVLENIFGFFPQADIYFILDVSPEVAQKRKQEVSLQETVRQAEAYKNLKEILPNALILKSDFPTEKIARIAEDYILQRCSLR